jgi:hypothetical protein
MSVIDIEVAMQHLLAEPEDQDSVQLKLGAAESSAANFIQRRFVVDQAALDAALAALPASITASRLAYEQAIADAQQIENSFDRAAFLEGASARYSDVRQKLEATSRAIVINDAIVAACLLILGSLYANREDAVIGNFSELPMGSKSLLMPYRVGMGA